jgi:hypothetical protein
MLEAPPETPDGDFGKHRTYCCPRCRRFCPRPLHAVPEPCWCGERLAGRHFRVDDCGVAAREGDFLGQQLG